MGEQFTTNNQRRNMRTGATHIRNWFDWEFYLRTYPDLQRGGITTKEGCIAHWLRHGHRERRQCRSLLSPPLPAACSVGVVVTTHGNNGVFVRQCIDSLHCHVNRPMYTLHVVLYINECGDDLTLRMGDLFPQIRVVRVSDQEAHGGLTGTWNRGIDWLLRERQVDMIILSNDDLFVDSSLSHLLDACRMCQIHKTAVHYFGPVTNNPGPAPCNQWQWATRPSDDPPRHSRDVNLNGFFMAFPRWVLERTMFDASHYFDPSRPFEGNEVEWFRRMVGAHPHGQAVVVPRTFVYHRKLKTWRSQPQRSRGCVYTVNTGGYETSVLLNHAHADVPVYYFTDTEHAAYAAIREGLVPMRIYNPDKLPPKSIQRLIKAMPHRYLPFDEHISVYLDGNCYFKPDALLSTLDAFERSGVDVLCWAHPVRSSIRTEAPVVVRLGLETQGNVDQLLAHERMRGFRDVDDHRLTDTNVLVRRHGAIVSASEEWARCTEICKGDQLSFDYAMHIYGVRVAQWPFAIKPVHKRPRSGDVRSRAVARWQNEKPRR